MTNAAVYKQLALSGVKARKTCLLLASAASGVALLLDGRVRRDVPNAIGFIEVQPRFIELKD